MAQDAYKFSSRGRQRAVIFICPHTWMTNTVYTQESLKFLACFMSASKPMLPGCFTIVLKTRNLSFVSSREVTFVRLTGDVDTVLAHEKSKRRILLTIPVLCVSILYKPIYCIEKCWTVLCSSPKSVVAFDLSDRSLQFYGLHLSVRILLIVARKGYGRRQMECGNFEWEKELHGNDERRKEASRWSVWNLFLFSLQHLRSLGMILVYCSNLTDFQ